MNIVMNELTHKNACGNSIFKWRMGISAESTYKTSKWEYPTQQSTSQQTWKQK